MNPYLLLAIGLLLIFVEFYLPGAIMGTLGGFLVVTSIVIFAMEATSPIAVIFYVIGALICIGLLIKFAIWKITHTKPEHSIYSDDAQVGYFASSYDESAIGKKGIVLTDLKPGGEDRH